MMAGSKRWPKDRHKVSKHSKMIWLRGRGFLQWIIWKRSILNRRETTHHSGLSTNLKHRSFRRRTCPARGRGQVLGLNGRCFQVKLVRVGNRNNSSHG